MVLVKNWQFFNVFIICKIGKKNVFENILGRIKAFPDYKNKKLQMSKNWDFSKRLVHNFGQKWPIFPSFYYSQNRP